MLVIGEEAIFKENGGITFVNELTVVFTSDILRVI